MDSLDLPTGLICVATSLGLSFLFRATLRSGGDHRWWKVPFHLQVSIYVSMIGFLFRGVDLIRLSKDGYAGDPGHINALGFTLGLSVAVMVCGIARQVWKDRHSAALQSRIDGVAELERTPQHGEALAAIAFDGGVVAAPNGELTTTKNLRKP